MELHPSTSADGEGAAPHGNLLSQGRGSPKDASCGPHLESPLLSDGGGHIRSCFICLEGPRKGRRGAPPKLLHPCCSQCYAVVHEKCWTAYRRRQRLAAFRARLLGHRAPDTTRCSICRTGRGGLPSDVSPHGHAPPVGEGASALQEQLLASLGRLLIDDEGVPTHPFCSVFCICLNISALLCFIVGGCLVAAFTELQGVVIFLFSLFLYYHFVLFEVVYIAITHRHEAMATLPPPPPQATPNEPEDEGDREGGSAPSSRVSQEMTENGGFPASGGAGEPPQGSAGGPYRSNETRAELQLGSGHFGNFAGWLASIWHRDTEGGSVLPISAVSSPFLPSSSLAVEMQMLHSRSVPS
ncbi:uncharacterized protein LOC113147518 [Cyclospora cayetanensis]|uniref:Uncharacterized protein LOC113147518 n=1 Tax=Cyclospora cayetanensis TaxID=88456 RepID=A0A6P6S359_9EIME|nr:uncharacterized protein LOC113147518 [Cyclospora cayetanensis]